MTLAHHYPDFGIFTASAVSVAVEDTDAEERLASFDEGFEAGWEEAEKARDTAQARAQQDLSQRLQEMSFTYQEAVSKVTQRLLPLVTEVTTVALPKTLALALAPQIRAQIETLLEDQAAAAIAVAVCPDQEADMRDILSSQLSLPFEVIADANLVLGQADLRVNERERQIDLSALLAQVADSVAAFSEIARKEA